LDLSRTTRRELSHLLNEQNLNPKWSVPGHRFLRRHFHNRAVDGADKTALFGTFDRTEPIAAVERPIEFDSRVFSGMLQAGPMPTSTSCTRNQAQFPIRRPPRWLPTIASEQPTIRPEPPGATSARRQLHRKMVARCSHGEYLINRAFLSSSHRAKPTVRKSLTGYPQRLHPGVVRCMLSVGPDLVVRIPVQSLLLFWFVGRFRRTFARWIEPIRTTHVIL
jgi:hypothetical protein